MHFFGGSHHPCFIVYQLFLLLCNKLLQIPLLQLRYIYHLTVCVSQECGRGLTRSSAQCLPMLQSRCQPSGIPSSFRLLAEFLPLLVVGLRPPVLCWQESEGCPHALQAQRSLICNLT